MIGTGIVVNDSLILVDFINRSHEKGASILLASHNMTEVERLCSSVFMMKKGVIIDQDSPKKLIQKHGRKNLEEVFLKLTREKYES